MGLKWNIDHMKKGFFLNENGEVLEVQNVYSNDGDVDNSKIKIGEKIFLVDDFKNYFDYNTSFDDIQLPLDAADRDRKMESVLKDLSQIKELDSSYYSKKILASGEEKSYFYERKESLKGTFFFYHNNTEDHPHFHMHLRKNVYLGRDCLKLRNELNKVFKSHEIVANCEIKVAKNNDTKGKYEIREFQNYKKTLENISWLYRQAESKVVNPDQSVRSYLDSKKIEYDRVNIYKANHCYFTLEKAESFTMQKLMTRGKNKGKTEEIKVHSLKEVLDNYTKFSDRAGSRQFLDEFISRVEKIEKVKMDRSVLDKYEKIDFTNSKEVLKGLVRKINTSEKINAEYKDYWRENINSDNIEKRILAEGIAEMYRFRQNNVLTYEVREIKKVYAEYIEKLNILSKNEARKELLLNKFEEYLGNEKVSDTNLCNRLKESFNIETLYLKSFEGKQFLVIDKERIAVDSVLEKFGQRYNNEFLSTYQVIKYNQLNDICLDKIENKGLREISTIFVEKMISQNKNIVFNSIQNIEIQQVEDSLCKKINKNRTSFLEVAVDGIVDALKYVYGLIKEAFGIKELSIKLDKFEETKIKNLAEKTVVEYKGELEKEKKLQEKIKDDERHSRDSGRHEK